MGDFSLYYPIPVSQTIVLGELLFLTQTNTVSCSTSDFEVTLPASTAIGVDETGSFTVRPKTGLAVGTHNAVLTITTADGSTETVDVSFTVTEGSGSTGGGGSSPASTGKALTDAASGIALSSDKLASGAILSVADVKPESISTYIAELSKAGNVLLTKDISLLGTNNSLTGEATLTFDLGAQYNGKTVTIVHYGKSVEQWFKAVADGKVSVTVSDLSPFVVLNGEFDVVGHENKWECPFKDIVPSDWFYDNVRYAHEKGLVQGVSAKDFAPNAEVSRAMLVTVLWRMENEPTAKESGFSDLTADWYKAAVAWAAEKGIVKGYGNRSFGPDDKLTREQLATILYNYASYKGFDTKALSQLPSFNDARDISTYAETAMQWAAKADIIKGSDSLLMPKATATRAQLAAVLERFVENNK